MMKHYYKECKTIRGINGYLKSIGLDEWDIDESTLKTYANNQISYFDFDGWVNSDETQGVSTTFYQTPSGYEVFASKYTDKDIARMDKA